LVGRRLPVRDLPSNRGSIPYKTFFPSLLTYPSFGATPPMGAFQLDFGPVNFLYPTLL